MKYSGSYTIWSEFPIWMFNDSGEYHDEDFEFNFDDKDYEHGQFTLFILVASDQDYDRRFLHLTSGTIPLPPSSAQTELPALVKERLIFEGVIDIPSHWLGMVNQGNGGFDLYIPTDTEKVYFKASGEESEYVRDHLIVNIEAV